MAKRRIYSSLTERILFFQIKAMSAEFKLKLCTLRTLHAHDKLSDWVKMIIDVIFNFIMSFRLLNTECFVFPGISDDKGLATMFGLKRILQRETYNRHF